ALPIAAGAQLIVGTPLLGILEHLVGLVDRLEFLLRAGFLVLVRMVFARQLAIRRLDLGLARIGLHAQDLVIVFEFHSPLPTHAKPATDRSVAGCTATLLPQWLVLMVMRRGVACAFFGITISSTPKRPF